MLRCVATQVQLDAVAGAAAHSEAVADAGGDLADARHLVVQLLELGLRVLQLSVHLSHLRLRFVQATTASSKHAWMLRLRKAVQRRQLRCLSIGHEASSGQQPYSITGTGLYPALEKCMREAPGRQCAAPQAPSAEPQRVCPHSSAAAPGPFPLCRGQ